MKLKMYFALLALGAVSLASCENDDNDDIDLSKVPTDVRNAFEGSYSNTTNLKWETENVSQQSYYKAEFNNKNDNNYKTSAWYTNQGKWQMTETEMPYHAIPTAIRTAFENSPYATWKKDLEVDKVERPDAETIYIIEVESATDEDIDLYYSADGVLIKAISDVNNGATGNGSLLPDTPSETVTAVTIFINEKYPNARIVEIDIEHGLTEIDIIHGNIGKEVILNSTNEWISTSWDIFPSQLPQSVSATIAAQYANYPIDDTEYFETPAGSYYLIELERKGQNDIKVKIDENGQVIK